MFSVLVIVCVVPVRVPNSRRSVPMVVSMRPRFSSCFRMFWSLCCWVVVVIYGLLSVDSVFIFRFAVCCVCWVFGG